MGTSAQLHVPSIGPMMVADIIDWEHKRWELADIENLISVDEVNEIFTLPITKNGTYTVKSGYHWIMGENKRAQSNRIESSRQVDEQVWNCIWACKTLPNYSCGVLSMGFFLPLLASSRGS